MNFFVKKKKKKKQIYLLKGTWIFGPQQQLQANQSPNGPLGISIRNGLIAHLGAHKPIECPRH